MLQKIVAHICTCGYDMEEYGGCLLKRSQEGLSSYPHPSQIKSTCFGVFGGQLGYIH